MFFDNTIREMFTVGGTDLFIHKFLGTDDGTVVKDEKQIQDLLFLENRDRKYDPNIYIIRGSYNVQDNDFDLSQFGLFLSNDTLFVTIHIRSSIDILGRKIMSGDVVEVPHLKDEYAANDLSQSLKRFYVVEDVNRSAEGFSPLWYPHLYRIKIKQIVDSQEFRDILNRPADSDSIVGEYNEQTQYKKHQIVIFQNKFFEVIEDSIGNPISDTNFFVPYQGLTLRDMMSTYNKVLGIAQAVQDEAIGNTPKSGYDIDSNFFTFAVDSDIDPNVDPKPEDSPLKHGYQGYLTGDEFAPNGLSFNKGVTFPQSPVEGEYFLRTDFLPNRMFRFSGSKWIKTHDVRRTSLDTRNPNTQRGSFINDTSTYIYEDALGVDFVKIEPNQLVIDTSINYVNAPYVVFYYEDKNRDGSLTTQYVVNEHPGLLTSYSLNDQELVRITLPKKLDYSGIHTITLYSTRKAQRQSLSQLLRPKADN